MGRFDGILLASDFDGTLTGSSGKIPQNNIDAIKYFIAEGGYFTVSTGRTREGFHSFREELINAPVLLGNGAMAYDYRENKIAFSNAIGIENKPVLEKMYKDNPYLGIEIYTLDGRVYCINKNEANLRHFEALMLASFSDTDGFNDDMFPIVKIMVSAGEKSKQLQAYLENNDICTLKYIPTNGSFVEILSVFAGKGRALHQLAEYLGVDEGCIFCAGDGSNDVDMLVEAPMSFSPSSGEEMARNAADKVMCSSDEGVIADIIRYLVKAFN